MIGNELVEYLVDHANGKGIAPAEVYIQAMANHCLEFIADDDDCKILDYMGKGVRRMTWDDNQLVDDMCSDLIPQVGEFLSTSKSGFEDEENEKLSERYSRAIAYYLSRENIWKEWMIDS